MGCTCEFCNDYAEFKEVMGTGSREELKSLLAWYFERLMDVEFELDYYKAIFDGSWPSAKEQALGIIARAEAREREADSTRTDDPLRSDHAVQENGNSTA